METKWIPQRKDLDLLMIIMPFAGVIFVLESKDFIWDITTNSKEFFDFIKNTRRLTGRKIKSVNQAVGIPLRISAQLGE